MSTLAAPKTRRPLTEHEAAVLDVDRIDQTLETGKRRLGLAILEAQRAAIRDYAAGGPGRLPVTLPMLATLRWVYRQGRAEARRELDRLGVRAYAAEPAPIDDQAAPEVVRAVTKLRPELDRLAIRIQTRIAGGLFTTEEAGGGVDVTIGEAAQTAVQRAVIRRLSRTPGALDAASRVITTAHNTGLADVYHAEAAGLFAGWQYSAILDAATCPECEARDGTIYATLAEAEVDLPGFGPNPYCAGDGRCRCRLLPTGIAA